MKPMHVFYPAAAFILALSSVSWAAELEPEASIADASTTVSADVEFAALANWQVGDEYRIEYSRERTDMRNGSLKTGKAWAIIKTRVEEKTPDGYLVAWTNEDSACRKRSMICLLPMRRPWNGGA